MNVLVVLLLAIATAACDNVTFYSYSAPEKPASTAAAPPQAPTASLPQINADRAMQYTREVTDLGPRPIGSEAHTKLQAYIRAHLKGVTVEEDVFTAQTAAGPFPLRNIIAKFPGTKDGIIVIAGHYDTILTLKGFVGANDGGSSTGLPLELAEQFKGRKLDGYSVWIVWFDGEEATKSWSDTDSLYGSKHLAQKWAQDGTLKKIKAFLLLDMIGDKDLNIEREQNSTPWLQDVVYAAATKLGYQSYFYGRSEPIDDDHLPFAKRGVPVVDLIDLNYGPNNSYHHTLQDTIDKVSPKSLQIVGDTVLETVQMLNQQ